MKKLSVILLMLSLCLPPLALAGQKKNPLEAWKPKFDPSGAKYTYLLSTVAHPVIEGAAVGYRIRDKVWEKSGGQLYVDFRPLGQMGGEKDVISKLKMGAIQGMLSSSVAAANISDVLGVVNLPFVIDTFDKLDSFRATPEIWEPFANGAQKQGILVADFTGYGPYGWATTSPVANLKDAKSTNFRIAQAPVNTDVYKEWKLKFTVMPWPDVPQALQTGVISGLDHTAIVCNISKKFTIAKYFTELNYTQGLYVHLINRRWLKKLPKDLQEVLISVIEEESAKTRKLTRKQYEEEVANAKESGVTFLKLSDEDTAELKKGTEQVLDKWGKKIGPDYLKAVQDNLKS
ncbi:MAG: TRAP transporter substrate-binding protein [Desulfobulbaceae bacterium]|nr:TRAP transporter substrate-binding protein [Desulfobulbaceae bacterium]